MSNPALCEFVDRNTVRFVRHHPHSCARVWDALTDPEQLTAWFLPVETLEARLGGRYSLPTPNGPLEGTFTEFEPPRVINFGGGMRFELFAEKGGCRMVFTLTRSPIGWAPGVLGGFHAMWDSLRDHLSGRTREEIRSAGDDRWREIFPIYEREISEQAAGGAKIIHRVHFDPMANEFRSDSELAFEEVAGVLKRLPHLDVVVDAYCDDPVDYAESMKLARRRADGVARRLEAGGIAGRRIITRVFGNSSPVFRNRLRVDDTEEARRFNRRVELMPTY